MNQYSIVVLGGRGAGKTVYLASMYRKLSVFGSHGFNLHTDGEDEKRLNEIYRVVATGDGWPPGTKPSEHSQWIFDVKVTGKDDKKYVACRFVYVDYAGGVLTDTDLKDPEMQRQIDEADSLLGILDGAKVFKFMQGDDPGGEFQYKELVRICQILQNSRSPVHFVLSKWDLFSGKYTLEEVRNRLLKDDSLRGLVSSRPTRNAAIRLIPVSSVGEGFAEWQPDGSMRKTGKSPTPFLVEAPFACVLVDKVQSELFRIKEEADRLKQTKIQVDPGFTFWDRLLQAVGGTVRVVRELLPEKLQFSERILKKTAEFLESSTKSKVQWAKSQEAAKQVELRQQMESVTDEASALEYAIECFLQLQARLDHMFPASSLFLPRSDW